MVASQAADGAHDDSQTIGQKTGAIASSNWAPDGDFGMANRRPVPPKPLPSLPLTNNKAQDYLGELRSRHKGPHEDAHAVRKPLISLQIFWSQDRMHLHLHLTLTRTLTGGCTASSFRGGCCFSRRFMFKNNLKGFEAGGVPI
jgi:hypothetical protein